MSANILVPVEFRCCSDCLLWHKYRDIRWDQYLGVLFSVLMSGFLVSCLIVFYIDVGICQIILLFLRFGVFCAKLYVLQELYQNSELVYFYLFK